MRVSFSFGDQGTTDPTTTEMRRRGLPPNSIHSGIFKEPAILSGAPRYAPVPPSERSDNHKTTREEIFVSFNGVLFQKYISILKVS